MMATDGDNATQQKRRRGRPTKLTPEFHAAFVRLLKAGNFREVAARALDVDPDTVGRWMRRGERERSGMHREFRRAVIEAETAAEMGMVASVMTAAKADPRHAEWYLERKFPERWGRRRVEIAAPVDPDTGEPTGEAPAFVVHLGADLAPWPNPTPPVDPLADGGAGEPGGAGGDEPPA